MQLTKCVFLPPVQFIVASEGHPFFEAAFGIRGPADDIALQLKTEGHVEVFRDVGLRPDLLDTIVDVDEGGILKSGPTEEGVVADEGRHLAVGARWALRAVSLGAGEGEGGGTY